MNPHCLFTTLIAQNNHADLILYTMKSDAPGRASDLAEIRDPIHKDKRTLLLLTGTPTDPCLH